MRELELLYRSQQIQGVAIFARALFVASSSRATAAVSIARRVAASGWSRFLILLGIPGSIYYVVIWKRFESLTQY